MVDLDSVKALTEKLKLQTRRPSYLEWKERLQAHPWIDATQSSNVSSPGSVEEDTQTFFFSQREMQMQDNRLARQLIRLRVEIHRLKVEQVCHRHKEMLDDATYELEECEEDSDLLSTLKHIGLTKMNLNSRRFSLC
ncbi:hypothetical protein PO909_011748 [Leuciscus waleckii]